MKPGYYWIIILDGWEGPEIGDMFFTTRSEGDGETRAIINDPRYVDVLAGPLEEPRGEAI
jgi:hypothetical protein